MSAAFTNLRHGDVVVIECDGPPGMLGYIYRLLYYSFFPIFIFLLFLLFLFKKGWEGVLSSDPRNGSDLEVVYTKKGDSMDHPDFLSKCVFRVDSSRGEEAPGMHFCYYI